MVTSYIQHDSRSSTADQTQMKLNRDIVLVFLFQCDFGSSSPFGVSAGFHFNAKPVVASFLALLHSNATCISSGDQQTKNEWKGITFPLWIRSLHRCAHLDICNTWQACVATWRMSTKMTTNQSNELIIAFISTSWKGYKSQSQNILIFTQARSTKWADESEWIAHG